MGSLNRQRVVVLDKFPAVDDGFWRHFRCLRRKVVAWERKFWQPVKKNYQIWVNDLMDKTHLVTIEGFHAEMKLSKTTEASKQKPSIIAKKNSDFIFDVCLFTSSTHDVAWDVN